MSVASNTVVVLAMDDRIWFDANTLVNYLRDLERQAQTHMAEAKEEQDYDRALAAYSASESIRQITDGFVLSSITAAEPIKGRRESRR